MKYLFLPVLAFLLLTPVNADAGNDACRESSADCITVGEWEFELAVGIGMRSNPLVSGQDIPLVLVPQWRYYGERWFVDNLELGYTIAHQPHFLFGGIMTPGQDRLYFHRWDPGNLVVDLSSGGTVVSGNLTDLRDRRHALLGGMEFSVFGGWGDLHAQLLWDVSGVHDGREWRMAYSMPF
jgi:outer membrane protein